MADSAKPGGGRRARRRAKSVVAAVAASDDPATTLAGLRSSIDDAVIDALMDLSTHADAAGDGPAGRRWARLACDASALGGQARTRAGALTWHAVLLVELAETGKSAETVGAAEAAAQTSLRAWDDLGSPDRLHAAQRLVVRVHVARGDRLQAVTAMIDCARTVEDIGDRARAGAAVTELANLYWSVPRAEELEGAGRLLQGAPQLVDRVTDPAARAALLDAIGDAHRCRDDERAARRAWTTAAHLYRHVGDRKGEFLVCGRMMDLAIEHERYDLAVADGEACIAAAPPDVKPAVLASQHHKLAVVYAALDEVDPAECAFRRAIEIHALADDSDDAAPVSLELALTLIDAGRLAAARVVLEQVAECGLPWISWVARIKLVELLSEHLGELGRAVELAGSALQTAVAMLPSATVRAYSLHLSGVLLMNSGDAETAYRRFAALEPLVAEPLEIELVGVSHLYDHPVVPPDPAVCAWWRHLACMATGRQSEAAVALAQRDALIERRPGAAPSMRDGDGTSALFADVRRGLGDFAVGVALVRSDPRMALEHLDRAGEDVRDLDDAIVLGRLHVFRGLALMRMGDSARAGDAFVQGLDGIPADGDLMLELGCRTGLALLALERRDDPGARDELVRCVAIVESTRSSLRELEQRMGFLGSQLPIYERLVAVHIRLGCVTEAFGVVQQMKSRALADLMAEPEHRPIDHALEARLASQEAEREAWIVEHLHDVSPYLRAHQAGEREGWRARELERLEASVKLTGARDTLTAERSARGLFDALVGSGTPVDFEAVRATLR